MNHVPSTSLRAAVAAAGGALDSRRNLASKSPSQLACKPETPTQPLYSRTISEPATSDSPSPCLASNSGQGRVFSSGSVPFELSETLSDRSWTVSSHSPCHADDASPFSAVLLKEDRPGSAPSRGSREQPRVPRLTLPLGDHATPETAGAAWSASANRTPHAVTRAPGDGASIAATKQRLKLRVPWQRAFGDARATAAALQRHSRHHFEQQRPLTEALSDIVAGLCGGDSPLDGSLADTTASSLLSEDADPRSAARGSDSEGSGGEDVESLPGEDLQLLQHALERDAELWWKSQRRLIRLIMRVADRRRSSGERCPCGRECSACGHREARKSTTQSASPRLLMQAELAGEPDACSSVVI